jgi:hypothetical protein
MKYILIIFFSFNALLLAQEGKKYFDLARKVMPDHKKAIYYLSKAIFKEPKNADYYFTRAKVRDMYGDGRKEDFEKDLKTAIQLNPNNPFYYLLGPDADFKKAYEVAPNNPYIIREALLAMSKEFGDDKIKKEMENLFKKEGESLENLFLYYRYLISIKEDVKAKASLQKFLKLTREELYKNDDSYDLFNENYTSFYFDLESVSRRCDMYLSNKYHLTVRLYELKQLDADIYYLKMGRRHGGNASPLTSATDIKAFYHVGQYVNAIKYSKLADNYIGELDFTLGRIYQKMGLFTKAAAKFKKIYLSLTYKKMEAAIEYIKCLADDGQYELALKTANMLELKNIDKDVLFRVLNCTICSKMENNGSWNDHYKKLTKFKGSWLEIMTQLQKVRTLSGFKATDIFRLIKDPSKRANFNSLIYGLISSSLAKKDKDSALKLLEKAKTFSPDDVWHTYQEARIHFLSNEIVKAEEKINTFLKDAPLDHQGIILKGMIHLAKGDIKGSHAIFGRLQNKKAGAYYQLVSLVCFGKFESVRQTCLKMINSGEVDQRVFSLLHMLTSEKDIATVDKIVKANHPNIRLAPYYSFAQYKLKAYAPGEYLKTNNYGPLHKGKCHFFLGFEALQKGDKEKAAKHFNNCFHPYSMDQPEYHMAKACLKMLKK